MSLSSSLFSLLAGVLSAMAITAQAETMDKPYLSLSQSTMVSAMVKAIERETREVTVDLGNGETLTFTAGPDVRNLDQVEVGDLVQAEYVRRFTAEVVANDGMEAAAAELGMAARAEAGEMPGAMASNTQIVTATVEAIDVEANTFALRSPDGVVTQYAARDPENLKRAEVGDLVVMTFTEGLAITVEEGARAP
ncbi:MAG: hypothetical protein V2I63_12210 [Pseudomonadales bacterium]|jgi:hypothetical protein|nr:hypothetical protein [Pseudomonadales bacterium]